MLGPTNQLRKDEPLKGEGKTKTYIIRIECLASLPCLLELVRHKKRAGCQV